MQYLAQQDTWYFDQLQDDNEICADNMRTSTLDDVLLLRLCYVLTHSTEHDQNSQFTY